MDLVSLSDQELNEHLENVMKEKERRQTLASIPNQIASLTSIYLASGGDPANLQPADPPTSPAPATLVDTLPGGELNA